MLKVQIDMGDRKYAELLREVLLKDPAFSGWQVQCGGPLHLRQKGVIVLDTEAFNRLPMGLPLPERVVLITRNEPEELSKAWSAGINSVVFDGDPLNTVILAILAARFRAQELEVTG